MSTFLSQAAALEEELLTAVQAAADPDALEAVRIRALGRKSALNGMLRSVAGLPGNERRDAGQHLNAVKERLASALRERQAALADAALEARLATERADITLPSRRQPPGRAHPISRTLDEMTAILGELGFKVAEGPHIEDDFHNFTALNIPPEHPARQDVDTFYLRAPSGGERKVLRTHTSPVQIRALRAGAPPLRIIAPGRTFRCDRDATHAPMFHQIEGLAIDRDLTMGHLKGTIATFVRAFFARDDVEVRFRPSYFPFTEPSAEVDISYRRTERGLEIGAGGDWLEVMGCGMVHPRVLDNCGVDRNTWQGFAWGLGVERFAMLKYGIPDLRTFFESDVAWLRHYGFDMLARPSLLDGLDP
jgi:phenylalanyl-tRNA synthetase alpha chain